MFLSPIAEESPPQDCTSQAMISSRPVNWRRQSIGVNIPVNQRPERGSTDWLPPQGVQGMHVIRVPTGGSNAEAENSDVLTSIFQIPQAKSVSSHQNNNIRSGMRRRSSLSMLPTNIGPEVSCARRDSLPKRRRSTLCPSNTATINISSAKGVPMERTRALGNAKSSCGDFSHLPSYMRPTQASLGWRRDKVTR